MSDHPISKVSIPRLAELAGWMKTETPPEELKRHLDRNLPRIRDTLLRVPPAEGPHQRLLDLGCYGAMIPWYVDLLGYRDITAIAYEPRMHLNEKIKKVRGETDFRLSMHFLNAEEDPWPLEDGCIDLVLCMELLEHMATDPMHLMEELNRTMRPGATLVLTTPNSASWGSVARCMLGEQPYSWSVFYGIPGLVNRHNREYTPGEVAQLMDDAGMEVTELTTIEYARYGLFRTLISRWGGLAGSLTRRCPSRLRGQKILVTARKTGPIRNRWPRWLYQEPDLIADKLAEIGEIGRRRLEDR